MSFLDEVRRALEHPEIAKVSLESATSFRRVLVSSLSELEASPLAAERVEWLHDVWSDKLGMFVREMCWQLGLGLAYGEAKAELVSLLEIALRRRLGLGASTGQRMRDRELDRVSTDVLFALDRPVRVPELFPERYVFEVRALRHEGERAALTPIGRLLLDLPEPDALRWLLSVEAVLSRGAQDPFRLCRASAARIAEANRMCVFWYGTGASPAHLGTLDRLSALSLLHSEDEAEEGLTNYEVTALGRQLLQEIALAETPMMVLAAALSEEETAAMLAKIRDASKLVEVEGAARVTSRHAQMVAHEVRNALVPVREAASDLLDAMRKEGRSTLVDRYGEAMTTGIDRVFRFVTEMVQVAERAQPSLEAFDVVAAIEEALAAHFSELGHSVRFERGASAISAFGQRDRFILSMIDLLRNASKSREDRAPEIAVSLSLDSSSKAILVMVDDDGPGVPLPYREAIFEPGFSMRPYGTGLGLSFVREVVCREFMGEVHCEESPLGGARFVLRIPSAPRFSPRGRA